MKDVVYTSRVRIERVKGSLRRAYLPIESEPIHFSIHSQIAEYYGKEEGAYTPHPATLDYVVAAAAG